MDPATRDIVQRMLNAPTVPAEVDELYGLVQRCYNRVMGGAVSPAVLAMICGSHEWRMLHRAKAGPAPAPKAAPASRRKARTALSAPAAPPPPVEPPRPVERTYPPSGGRPRSVAPVAPLPPEPPKAPSVPTDWSRVPPDTPVVVVDSEGRIKIARFVNLTSTGSVNVKDPDRNDLVAVEQSQVDLARPSEYATGRPVGDCGTDEDRAGFPA